jgi:uncharacterized protein (TIGR02246 family)
MRKRSLVPILISAIIPASLLLAAVAPPAGGAARVEAAWMKAMKANDLEAVVACYAPDAVLWMSGEAEVDGIDAIRATYAGMLRENTVKDVSVSGGQTRLSGNVGAGWGRYTLTLSPKTGGPDLVMRGRFTEVVEKRNGKWLYVADHASDDPPAAPAR